MVLRFRRHGAWDRVVRRGDRAARAACRRPRAAGNHCTLKSAGASDLDRAGVHAVLVAAWCHHNITADVAAAPLLWVAPLILHLLTFILVFARRLPLRHATMVWVLPMLLVPLVITAAPGVSFTVVLPLILVLHLGCFFVVGMVCHGELARRRPPAARLTEFYLFLSVGGVLGARSTRCWHR
jgi:hypothetical protein